MSQKIKQAAIKLDGKVFTGSSHNSILKEMKDSGILNVLSGIQGFTTETGEFFNRKEAAQMAIQAGQVKKLKHPPMLYMEDLIS